MEPDELTELLASDLSTFYAPTDRSWPDLGERWLQTALSEGVTVEALFRNQALLSASLATYPESSPDDFLLFTVDPSGNPTRTDVVHGIPTNVYWDTTPDR